MNYFDVFFQKITYSNILAKNFIHGLSMLMLTFTSEISKKVFLTFELSSIERRKIPIGQCSLNLWILVFANQPKIFLPPRNCFNKSF